MIHLKNVDKFYGSVKVLSHINVAISPTEQCVIWGKSGSGKSSLLYLLGGLEKVTKGSISVGEYQLHQLSDDELAQYRRDNIGFIFQFHFLLPTLSCWENVLLPLKLHPKLKSNREKDQLIEQGLQWCKELELSHLMNKFPYQISGGEQQRFSLLRALITRPAILLCDEPTGNLDSQNAGRVVDLLQQFASSFKSTLIVVTHDRDLAQRFDRKIMIEDGCLFG